MWRGSLDGGRKSECTHVCLLVSVSMLRVSSLRLDTSHTPAWSLVDSRSQMLVTTIGSSTGVSLWTLAPPCMSFLTLSLPHEICLCIPLKTLSPTTWLNTVNFWLKSFYYRHFTDHVQHTTTWHLTGFPKSMIHEGSGATKLPIQQQSSSHHFSNLLPRNMFFPVSLSSVAPTMTLYYLPPYVFLYKASVSEITILSF